MRVDRPGIWRNTECHAQGVAEFMKTTAAKAESGDTNAVSRLMQLADGGTPATFAHVMLLGLDAFDAGTILRRVSNGLSYRSYEVFRKNLGFSSERLLNILDIPRRTLLRRKQEGRFSPAESDRLVRLSRLVAKAVLLFEGNRDAALEWLSTPRAALGGATPFALAASEVGGREVEALIDRLEHGVFS